MCKKGQIWSPELRARWSEIRKGKKHSEETKRKISETQKNKAEARRLAKEFITEQENKTGVKPMDFLKDLETERNQVSNTLREANEKMKYLYEKQMYLKGCLDNLEVIKNKYPDEYKIIIQSLVAVEVK